MECSENCIPPLPVTVEEIKVDQPVETWYVEQERGDRSPDVKSGEKLLGRERKEIIVCSYLVMKVSQDRMSQ